MNVIREQPFLGLTCGQTLGRNADGVYTRCWLNITVKQRCSWLRNRAQLTHLIYRLIITTVPSTLLRIMS